MKKMIAFLLLAVLALFLKGKLPLSFDEFDNVERVVIVSKTRIDDCDNCIENGDDFYCVFEGENVKNILDNIQEQEEIKGVNLYFSKDTKLSYFQEKLDYLSDKSQIDDVEIYYGYYKGYQDFEWLEGKKINVQLARVEDGWIMGFPMILTGF